MKTTAMTTTQLQETGLGDAQIRKLVAHGQLRRLRRGVYLPARGDDAVGQHQELIAATLGAVDATNVVSHTSAAVLHGLPVRSASLARVTMTRTTAGHMKRGAHLLVRDTSIEAGEITELDGIRVTTLARTVADVARTEPLIWGVAAADAAMAQGFQPAQLAQVVAAHPRLHGTRRARSVGKFATPFSESPAE